MKRNRLILGVIALAILISSCETGHKDCRGHRHHVKTEMGGYL